METCASRSPRAPVSISPLPVDFLNRAGPQRESEKISIVSVPPMSIDSSFDPERLSMVVENLWGLFSKETGTDTVCFPFLKIAIRFCTDTEYSPFFRVVVPMVTSDGRVTFQLEAANAAIAVKRMGMKRTFKHLGCAGQAKG